MRIGKANLSPSVEKIPAGGHITDSHAARDPLHSQHQSKRGGKSFAMPALAIENEVIHRLKPAQLWRAQFVSEIVLKIFFQK